MNEPWKDFQSNTATVDEDGPWNDFKSGGPWNDYTDKSAAPLTESVAEPVSQPVAEPQSRYAGQGSSMSAASPSTPGLSVSRIPDAIPSTAFPGGAAEQINERANTPEELAKTEALQTPLVKFPRLTEKDSETLFGEGTTAKVIHGIQNAVADLGEGSTTPEMLAVMPWLAVPGPVGVAIKGIIAADMAKGSLSLLGEIHEAYRRGDTSEVARLSATFGANTLMALGLSKHAATSAKFGMPVTEPGQAAWTAGRMLEKGVRDGPKPFVSGNRDNAGSIGPDLKKAEDAGLSQSAEALRIVSGDESPLVEVPGETVPGRVSEIVPEAPKGETAAKEPWQYTKSEWSSKIKAEYGRQGFPDLAEKQATDKTHRAEVEQAVKEGKPVPVEVLDDYPNLPKPASNKPIAAPAEFTETGPGMVGMGADRPGENKTYSENTGIKDASITEQRELRGMDALERGEQQKWQAGLEDAQSRMSIDSTWLDRLENELIDKPRPMDTTETAGMLTRLTKLRQEYDAVADQISKAHDAGLPTDELNLRAEKLNEAISKTEGAVSIGGAASESGRSLNALKMMMAQDFTLAKMESSMRANRGGAPITPEERIQLIKDHEAIQLKLAAAEAAEAKARSDAASADARAVLAEMNAAKAKQPEFHPSILEHAERLVSRMESTATKYAKEIFGQFNSPTPDVLAKAAFIGATKLARIGLDLAKWTTEMVKELGEGFRPYAEQVFEASKAALDEHLAKAEKVPGAPRVTKAVKQAMTSVERKEEIKSKIDAKIKGGEESEITNLVQQLARQFVEDGIHELEPLLDKLHETLKEVDPNISRRTVQDAFTGYGKTSLPSQDTVSKTVAELKGQGLETGKLIDIEEGKPLKKTGFLRGVMSDTRRRLVAKVNEYKRRFGVVTTDPETQLKSALDSRKTALRNQIKDLEDQIASREKFIKKRTASPTDAETEALKSQRDELKVQFDEIFTKPEMTDARRLELSIAAAKQNETMWQERLKNAEKGVFGSTKEPGKKVTSPELEAIRARIELAKEQIKELHDLDEAVQQAKRDRAIESEKKALEKQIAEQQRRLTDGDLDPVGKAFNRPHANPAIESLLQQRDSLSNQLAEARKKPEAQKAAEALDRKVKAIEKTITLRQAKLDAGDLSSSGKARPINRPLPPELESARQRLDALNKQISLARKAARPVKTPEQIALQTLKTRIASETVKYLKKLAKGDYAATLKRPPFDLSKDPATMKAKAELEALKNKWLREGAEERTRNLKGVKKAVDYALESMHLQQNMVSSFDLSALRQAVFVMLNPLRAKQNLRAIGSMIQALSKKRAEVIEQKILNRPNSVNGVYAQAKLRLVKLDETKYSLQDESIRGRWASKIPGIAASNRAFSTLLNLVRADTFDAMYASAKNKSSATTRAIGAFVNDASGYGDLGSGKLGRTADALSTVLWSPRLLASRFRLMTGASLWKGTMESRRLIAKEYAGTLMGMWAMYQLASLAGFEIEDDPNSSSFGKLKDGDVYLDPMGGLIQVTVLTSRISTGEIKTQKGDTRSTPTYETIARFLRMKFRPSISAAINTVELATKDNPKSVIGEPITPGSIVKELVTPMSMGEVLKVMEEAGVAKGTLYEIFQVFGGGLQVYNAEKNKR